MKKTISELLNKSINALKPLAGEAKDVADASLNKIIEIGKDTKAGLSQLIGKDVNAIANRVTEKAKSIPTKDNSLVVAPTKKEVLENAKNLYNKLEKDTKLNALLGTMATTAGGATLASKIFGENKKEDPSKKTFKDYLKSL